jgi:hypothetical protein
LPISTTILRDAETAFDPDHAATRLDEQQRLGRHRVIQFLGVLGVIAADTDHLAKRKVNLGAVDVFVLVAHERS